MARSHALPIALLAAAIVGCPSSPPPTPADAAPTASAAPRSGDAAPEAPDAAAKEAGAPVERDAGALDPTAERAYRASLDRGRRATAAKDYPAAIRAFDEAVAASPLDGRAYAERGYAKLLERRDLDGAGRDLERAVGLTRDPKLLAAIWFNRGLLAEARGDAASARDAFAVSSGLAPSAAAAAKLGGKPACAAHVDATPAPPEAVVRAPSFLALHAAMAKGRAWEGEVTPATEAEAKKELLAERAGASLPVVAVSGIGGRGREAWLVGRDGAGLVAVRVGQEIGGRCPGEVDFTIAAISGPTVHVHGVEVLEGGYTFVCIPAKGDPRPCADADWKDDAVQRQSACLGGEVTERDVVVDLATGRALVTVDRPKSAKAPIAAQLKGSSLELRGGGCDRVVPLAQGDAGAR